MQASKMGMLRVSVGFIQDFRGLLGLRFGVSVGFI